MAQFPIFMSVVYVVHNQATGVEKLLKEASKHLSALVSDYELIVIDNASSDNSLAVYRQITGEQGLPNLQVYALTKKVDVDTASWVGLENALGDYVAVLDPMTDDIGFVAEMLEQAAAGTDVVFAMNQSKAPQSMGFRLVYGTFNFFYRKLTGIDLAREAPQYRLLTKKVVNFILQHPHPAITYRHLPATGGFSRANLSYSATPLAVSKKQLSDSLNRGIRLLMATTRAPMRLVTVLSLFGAMANLLYSFYVLGSGLLRENIAPGWVSLSLQQSGMFFLISLVLFVLGEYILNMASLSTEGPPYHVAQEFTSARMTRREKLNIEESYSSPVA